MKYIFILLTLLFTSCNTLKIQVQVGPVGKPCKTYINISNKVTPANFSNNLLNYVANVTYFN